MCRGRESVSPVSHPFTEFGDPSGTIMGGGRRRAQPFSSPYYEIGNMRVC